jgi:uncharacterized protein YjbI with pentapeptide repeats
LNPAEHWVVAQATAGEIADLSKRFPEERDRRLGAHFLESLLLGKLSGAKLHPLGVRLNGAIIDEPIDLENAQIPCEVRLEYCQFSASANFTSASFTGAVSFDNSTFKGEANFSSFKVGGDALFNSALFEGGVYFGGAEIARNFQANRAEFQNKEKPANFNGMKVGGDASFAGAVFEGPVDFSFADIARNFRAGTKFRKWAGFAYIKVRGSALFNGAEFEGPVTVRYGDFASLDLSNVKVAAQFDMQGMSYKYILAIWGKAGGTEPESHKELLKLADQSPYSADVYSHLEEFFLRQGYRGDADEAFTAGKHREREEYFRSGQWFRWLGSWMLDLLVGYGRRPWQAGIPSAFLVALGCLLFSPKKMEPQKPEDTPRVYSCFWYSLGLFLPFVDLQADKVWKPKADQTFLRNYMRVHILLGWILIPIVLAALTGLIK